MIIEEILVVNEYGLGSGCYAEPRVGESIRSKHNVRNKFVKTEDRSNDCEHLIPESTKREGKLCQLLDPEIVGLSRLCLLEVHKFYMPRKKMDFLIEMYECRDSIFRGQGGNHLCNTDFDAFFLFFLLFSGGSNCAVRILFFPQPRSRR